MSAWELFLTALWSLRANKLRSALTMLGIFIGVASILTIMAIGGGGQAAVISTLESARLQDTVQIVPSAAMAPGLAQPGQVTAFTSADFNLARQFVGVSQVYATLYGQAMVSTANASANASVDAGPEFLNEIGHFTVVRGRMYSALDVLAHRRVALLSASMARQLFSARPPLGQMISMGGQPLEVIGIADSTSANPLAGYLGSEYVYLPSTTCIDLFPWWAASEMDVQLVPGVNKAALSRRIVTALNIRVHRVGAFSDSSELWLGIAKTVSAVTNILTLVIGSIAGIALVVGGVGVMNIMLVAVSERTREIGIRVSLGATRRAILAQFLMESATITLLGGLLGIIGGLSAAAAVRMVTQFPVRVSWWAIVLSTVFSVVIGILCGLYPANKAAQQNPIDALRHE